MIKILLVDDHPVVRRGIRTILTERLKDAFVGEAGDATTALEQARHSEWDVFVVDISLPGTSGLDLIKELHRLRPALPTLALSMHPAVQFARRAINAGAVAYLTKDSEPDEFIAAIDEARRGRPQGAREAEAARAVDSPVALPHERLSDREYQFLRMVGSGQTASDIARDLNLSVKTVSTYRLRVLKKMGMRTNAELMRYAIENRLLDS
jgi:DNA-binding NarL/FixJ family response regulator